MRRRGRAGGPKLLLEPPKRPVGAPFDWPAVEQRLGSALPQDYRRYCDAYGHGGFEAFWSLDILTPGCPETDLDLLDPADWIALPDHVARYPQAGGLLAFGSSETQMSLWWSTEGDPDRWPVVLLDDLDGLHELGGMTMTEVLAETLRGEGRLGWLDLDAEEDDEDVVELAFEPPGASRPTSTAKAPRRRRPGGRSPRAARPTTRRALEGWYVTWAGERAEILAGGIAPQEWFGETVVLFADRAVALREGKRIDFSATPDGSRCDVWHVDLTDMPNTHHLDWDGEGREVELDDARTVPLSAVRLDTTFP